jgi:hypothetical protein
VDSYLLALAGRHYAASCLLSQKPLAAAAANCRVLR